LFDRAGVPWRPASPGDAIGDTPIRAVVEDSREAVPGCLFIARPGTKTDGAEVVVVGRSNIVGKPIANMMLQKAKGANSTVTIVHTATKDMAAHCLRADILLVAAGVPGLVKPEWIKPGACVIDVGVNRVGEKISEKTGKKVAILRGDVDFDRAKEIAGSITPVPGGVGPMTITMLMKNTLTSLKAKLGVA
jgi:methylenetetrahydrofolate dehydrogenase (NADP+)/methenyltetrahydrofolate cyclohydrolase